MFTSVLRGKCQTPLVKSDWSMYYLWSILLGNIYSGSLTTELSTWYKANFQLSDFHHWEECKIPFCFSF